MPNVFAAFIDTLLIFSNFFFTLSFLLSAVFAVLFSAKKSSSVSKLEYKRLYACSWGLYSSTLLFKLSSENLSVLLFSSLLNLEVLKSTIPAFPSKNFIIASPFPFNLKGLFLLSKSSFEKKIILYGSITSPSGRS